MVLQSSDSNFKHGQIRCGTISVVDLDESLSLYKTYLYQSVIEVGVLDAATAEAWGTPNMQGSRYALLQSKEGIDSYLRLVELPEEAAFSDQFEPAKTYGWSAFEITVKDVYKLAEELGESDFDIVGEPKEVDGFTSFIPMQVFGPNGEILFLNQVNHSEDDVDLPKAELDVEQIFIVVLATADREKSVQEYKDCLQLDEMATHCFRYSLINRAFELDAETTQTITMIQKGRRALAQIDQYPENATARHQKDGFLPPGNSMVSIMVESIDALPLAEKQIRSPALLTSGLYEGRRSVVIRGSASELIELIEINKS